MLGAVHYFYMYKLGQHNSISNSILLNITYHWCKLVEDAPKLKSPIQVQNVCRRNLT